MSQQDQNVNKEKFVSQIKDVLDDSVNRIDAETSQRLVAARKQALEKAPRKFSLPKLITAAATAVSILLAVVLINNQFNTSLENQDVEEMELIATQDTFDLYEELEFYTWLVEEDVAG